MGCSSCGKKSSSKKTAAKSNTPIHRPLSYNNIKFPFGKPSIKSSLTFGARGR